MIYILLYVSTKKDAEEEPNLPGFGSLASRPEMPKWMFRMLLEGPL